MYQQISSVSQVPAMQLLFDLYFLDISS